MAARKRRSVSTATPLAATDRRRAIALGTQNAKLAIKAHQSLLRTLTAHRKTRKPTELAAAAGTLLFAEGDSWFAYPGGDVLTALQHGFGYEVERVSRAGDTVESMAYDPQQLMSIVERYRDLESQGREPKVILLSGGGNDIAGSAIESLLNHRNDPAHGLNESVMTGIFDQRIHAAMVTEIGTLSQIHFEHFGTKPKVVIHGYDYAIPDNRGYLTGIGPLPGPWLAPQFRRRGYEELDETAPLMRPLIDRFNSVAKTVATELSNVVYVDVRGTLSREFGSKAYRKDWANELHPTQSGFLKVAQRFDVALKRLV